MKQLKYKLSAYVSVIFTHCKKGINLQKNKAENSSVMKASAVSVEF